MGLEDAFHKFDFLSFISVVLPKYTKVKSLRDRAYLRTYQKDLEKPLFPKIHKMGTPLPYGF